MNLELVTNAVVSETAGEELLQALDAKISGWLSDQRIDKDELAEILAIEESLRGVIEEKLLEHQGKGTNLVEIFPGSPYVVLGWLLLANLVLMDGITLRPFRASDESRTLVNSAAAKFVVRELSPFPALNEFTTAKSFAALVFLGFIGNDDELNDHLDTVANVEPVFGETVRDFALEMSDTFAELVENDQRLTMPEYFEILEEAAPKDYNKHYRTIPPTFLDQKYIANMWVTDYDLKQVHLVFGESKMSLSHEKSGTRYLNMEDVRGIVIGSLTERMHTGFSYTDYHKWTIDIYANSGAVYQYTVLLSTDNRDANERREALTRTFNAIDPYYPVTSSGNHSVSESGYRTTMSYWF